MKKVKKNSLSRRVVVGDRFNQDFCIPPRSNRRCNNGDQMSEPIKHRFECLIFVGCDCGKKK